MVSLGSGHELVGSSCECRNELSSTLSGQEIS